MDVSFPDYPSDWDEIKKEVLELDKYRCQNCGTNTMKLHIHHIIPLSEGGSNDISNLVSLCEDCHKVEHPHMVDIDFELDTQLRSHYLHCDSCKRNFIMESNLVFCPNCETFLTTERYLEPKKGMYDYHYLKYGVSGDLENEYQQDEDDWEIN